MLHHVSWVVLFCLDVRGGLALCCVMPEYCHLRVPMLSPMVRSLIVERHQMVPGRKQEFGARRS
eukprot:994774-Heterocapsa_arctica.AAC.1